MSDGFELVASAWFRQELAALPQEQQDRIDGKLAAFTSKGWSAAKRDQTVKHLDDGIYELRIVGHGPAYRLLFFVVPGRQPRIVVLTTCAAKSLMKKRQRMESEIERAKSRRAAWREEMRKKEEAR
jgi:phage-related protein